MSPVTEAGLTCLREMRKNLRSAKGIVMGVLFLLGGGTASLIYAAVSELAGRPAKNSAQAFMQLQAIRQEVWTQVWNEDVGKYVAQSPSMFVALFKASVWLIPVLTLLIGFDQVSGDMQHRTIRFMAVRARRPAIVAGKALAVWGVVSLLLLALHMFVWVATVWRGDATFAETMNWGPLMWLRASVFVAPYAGLTVLVSSVWKRPILSLFIGLVSFSGIWVLDLVVDFVRVLKSTRFAFLEPVGYLVPDFYEAWLVTPRAPEIVGATVILLAYGVLATAAAGVIVNRRDV